MKVFIQSLSRRKDRRENIRKELEKVNIKEYHFINSIDAEEYSLRSVKDIRHFKTNRMPAGYVANHVTRNIAFQFIGDVFPDEEILYLEDDLTFDPNFLTELENAKKFLPTGWDLLNLGCYDVQKDKSTKVNEVIYKPKYPVHSHCILYSNFGILKISSILQSFTNTFDIQQVEHLTKINYYATYKLLATQNNKFGSDGNK